MKYFPVKIHIINMSHLSTNLCTSSFKCIQEKCWLLPRIFFSSEIWWHCIYFLWILTLCCKSIRSFSFLWCKMPMFRRAGMREEGKPLPLAFQYLIFMVWRHCDLNLVMISSHASKCQDFKFEMPFFQPLCVMKLKTFKFKVLASCCQWRYHYQIQITRSSYHKNQILKC